MKPSIIIATLVTLGVAGLFSVRIKDSLELRAAAMNVAAPVTTVTTVQPSRRSMTRSLRFTGVVRPQNEVDISARLPARVERVLVDVGEMVKAGAVLAELEAREMVLQLRQAEAQLLSAQAGLEKAKADVTMAEQNAGRMRALRAENALSQVDLEKAEAGLLAARTGVKVSEAQVAVAESGVGLVRELVLKSKVTSPVAGTVTRRIINVGAMAMPGMPAFQVQDVSTLLLDGQIGAEDFPSLKPGMVVDVKVDGVPGQSFSGKIKNLSPTLDPQTRRAAVQVTIDNLDGRIMPNMLGSVEIKLGAVDNVLTVPASAVVTLPNGRGLFLAREGRVAALDTSLGQVSLGTEEAGFIEVQSGVTDSDAIIVSDPSGLLPGTPVKVASAASARVTP